VLIGRDRELGQAAALLDDARRGRSGTLAIVGDPGVGKTTLLEEARRSAPDMRLLGATGVETESELPFAALHELLRPLLPLLDRVPPAQARALSFALALEEGEADSLAVGAGTLSLLVEAAEEQPTLVLLDDAQWLDRASVDALLFAVRRLRLEQVGLLAAFRPGTAPAFDSLPRLELGPLPPQEARELLRTRLEPVSPADEARILAAAAGNPLALLELPAALAHELPTSTSSVDRLRRAFAERLDSLPPATRRCLLLAAAEPDSDTVRQAFDLEELGESLGPAEAAGLIRVEDTAFAFRHPIVRSLVYADAAKADRATAHASLAAVLTSEADRDRRAWHLAAAAETEDENVAALLEETAERAAARGGQEAEARALERAARLSPLDEDRARRLYSASRAAFWAGDATHAFELGEEALGITTDPLLRADLLSQIRGIDGWRGGAMQEAPFLRALEQGGLDDERTSKLLYDLVTRRLDHFDAAGAAELARRMEPFARNAGPFWGPRHLAGAAASYLLAGESQRAMELFRELAADPEIPAGFAYDYMSIEWYDDVRAALDETLRVGRAKGHRLRIAWNQSCLALLEVRVGRLAAAVAPAAEAISVAETIGTPALAGSASGALALAHAWSGQADTCRSAADVALTAAREPGDPFQEGIARQALALCALAENRPDDAISTLSPLARTWRESSVVEPSVAPYLPELVEALLQAGATDEAVAWLDCFEEAAAAAGRTWALAACARCRGMLADGESFDGPFDRALELLTESPLALERARTQLAYGERLRRARRLREARLPLQAAFDAFVTAGATPWQERAATELRAAGVEVGAPARPRVELTPQELHIATLVAEGKTNKEIAAAMYLSSKTVEYHLANAYRKLDIHTRAELARLVTQSVSGEGS
jgi:DNA-binding CsgD family transcriptional regulator